MPSRSSLSGRSGDGSAEAGFSLVEVLITLCITALVATLLASSITHLRPMSLLTEKSDAQAQVEAAAAYLEKVILEARPLTLMNPDPNSKAVFLGGSTGFRTVSVVLVGNEHRALRDVDIRTIEQGGQLALVQASRARRVGPAAADEPFTILSSLQSVSFEYQRRPHPNEAVASAWLDEWRDVQHLPGTIRLRLTVPFRGSAVSAEHTVVLRGAR